VNIVNIIIISTALIGLTINVSLAEEHNVALYK